MSHIFEIAQLFFKLGCFAFGGPVAHIAMMEDECVQKRKWMSHEEFLDLIGVTNLIPGPNSTEMAMHVGYLRGGMLGLIVAGVCFITPAAVLTGILTYLYITFNYLPEFDAVFYGIRAGILVIILQAVLKLGKKAVTTRLLGVIGIASMGLSLYGMNEVLALLMSGLVGTVWLYGNKKF
ncbi:MAG: chromate transporter, partial [Candidatus Omnitrophota bacterium]